MNDIKTWQERQTEYLKKYPRATVSIEMFMKDELEDYRKAARATPAQPDSVLWAAAEKLASIWDGCEGEGIDDIGATIRHDFKMFAKELGAQQPSPSSVGDAIRAMELSAINVSEEHMADWTPREKVAFEYGARAMRSEAAALAEQVQWQQMPEGWILVPDGATKEWKAALVKSGYKASTIIDDVLAAAPSIAQDGQKSEADHE
jgi:hypothetical protein